MPTETHDIPIPDGPYSDQFKEAIQILDRRLLLAGTLDERPEPSEDIAGLWFLDVEGEENEDAEAVLYACRHIGEWEVVDLEIGTDLETVPQTDDHFTITATWSGRGDGGTWVADITGAASFAEEVPEATAASTATLIGGLDGTEFVAADVAETVSAPWRYTVPQRFESGVSVTGGAVGLPGHTDDSQ